MSFAQAFQWGWVWGIGRQIEQLGSDSFDPLPLDLMRTQVVHDHHLAGLETGAEHPVQVSKENLPVRGHLDGHDGEHALGAHSAQDGEHCPVASTPASKLAGDPGPPGVPSCTRTPRRARGCRRVLSVETPLSSR